MESQTQQQGITDRDIRQRDIAAPAKLAETVAYVVGTGAIGRQVALQLAAIGVGTIVLIDFDTVGPENLAAQGFLEGDLNNYKVLAIRAMCHSINSEIIIHAVSTKFKKSILAEYGHGAIFCCVDSMEARQFIWKSAKGNCSMFVDGRMAAEVCRILVVRSKKDYDYYASTLFSDTESYEATCTAKTTLYCANVAAGFMVAQLTKLYRGIPYDRDTQINILSNEMHDIEHRSKATAAD